MKQFQFLLICFFVNAPSVMKIVNDVNDQKQPGYVGCYWLNHRKTINIVDLTKLCEQVKRGHFWYYWVLL